VSGIKKVILFLFLIGMANFSFAQNFDDWLKEEKITKHRKIKKAAKQANLFGKDYLALALYDQLVLLKPENTKYLVKAAQISQKLNNYEKANNYLSQLIFIDSSANNMLNWASLQIQISDTENVEKTLVKLTETKTNAQFTRDHKKLAENLLAGFKLQQKTDSLIPHPYEFKELKNINSTFSEQSPKLYKDLLYYISYKPNTQVILTENEFLADKQIIYVAKNMGYQWNIIDSVLPNLPDPKSQFIGSISPLTDTLWLTSVCAANYRGKTVCQLYWAKNYNGKLQDYEKLPKPINQVDYTSTQPFAYFEEPEKIRFYFTSNQPKTKGGLDIWFAEYKTKQKTYSGPRNAGSKINSVFNEAFPNYTNNHLFFSSNYHAGFGGYDIFKAYGEKTKFNEPKNVFEVNSSYDDIAYHQLTDSTYGVMLSNRPNQNQQFGEGCCDDLYTFKIENSNEIPYFIEVYEMIDGKPKTLYNVNAFIGIIENGTSQTIFIDTLETGMYSEKLDTTLQWQFRVGKSGYFYEALQWNNKAFDTINENKPLKIEIKKIPKGEILLKDIYYEFDSPDLTPKAITTIQNTIYKILIYNPELSIQINSHTDSKGKLSYNYKLSKARAKSVVDYLIELGIDKNRLQSKGYGETKPVADNFNHDGTDNPEGRALNRRTTFTVLGWE